MNDKSSQAVQSRQPVIIAVLVVLIGTCLNLLIWTSDGGRRSQIKGDLTDEFVRVSGDMGFVRWSSESQLDEVAPNMLFAVVNGKIVGRFEFDSTSYENLVSADINDTAQRPWIHADHLKGTYDINCFPGGDTRTITQPDMTYRDSDGDGLPDRKIEFGKQNPIGARYSIGRNSRIVCDAVNSNGA